MEYEIAVKHMTRRKLEDYAVAAAETLERLEAENTQLRQDIQSAQMVDMDVIKGWRRWSQVVDEEREKWAETATRLTEENEIAKSFIAVADKACSGILIALEEIGEIAAEESEEGTNQKAMRKALKKIVQLSREAREAYDEYFAEPDDEDDSEEPAPEDTPQDDQGEENPQDEQVETDDER